MTHKIYPQKWLYWASWRKDAFGGQLKAPFCALINRFHEETIEGSEGKYVGLGSWFCERSHIRWRQENAMMPSWHFKAKEGKRQQTVWTINLNCVRMMIKEAGRSIEHLVGSEEPGPWVWGLFSHMSWASLLIHLSLSSLVSKMGILISAFCTS